jgi:hypothetical protein
VCLVETVFIVVKKLLRKVDCFQNSKRKKRFTLYVGQFIHFHYILRRADSAMIQGCNRPLTFHI